MILYSGIRDTVESNRAIDVRKWQRGGFLTPGNWFSTQWSQYGQNTANISVRAEINKVILSYRVREPRSEWKDITEPITLEHTPCYFGGSRPWFLCPNCNKRVAILYGRQELFLCRHCSHLNYTCTREHGADRMARKIHKLNDRHGWPPGVFNGAGEKPLWMRWPTYKKILRNYENCINQVEIATIRQFGMSLYDF